MTTIDYSGLRELQALCYEQSASKGFHNDRPAEEDEQALGHYRGNKLMLVVGEVIEGHEELRKGKAPTETYYVAPDLPLSLVAEVGVEHARELITADNAGKPQKPEGVPSELADAVIRILDFCGAEKIDLADIIEEKLAYNMTRAQMHGGKRF